MNGNQWPEGFIKYVGLLLVITLVLSLFWDISNDWGGSEIFTGIGLLLALAVVV